MSTKGQELKKRKASSAQKTGVLVPAAVIVFLIVGLTAGGIVLSMHQTQKAVDRASAKETSFSQKETEEDAEKSGTEEETEAPEEETAETVSEESVFADFTADLETKIAEDPAYLTSSNKKLKDIWDTLDEFDRESLNEEQKDLYDILEDVIAQEDDKPYQPELEDGQRMFEVKGGNDYYSWLLKELSGTDLATEQIHSELADELNNNYALVTSYVQADPSLLTGASAITKNSAPDAYLYGNVTASSDPLKLALAPDGLKSGWGEFGLLRAYMYDSALTDAQKNYMTAYTRMAYALYGVLDISVHIGGWGQDEVSQLIAVYFGTGQEEFAASMYQLILQNPGCYAAAGMSYLKISEIAEDLLTYTAGYTDQTLFDLLFGRGPASFRVIDQWMKQ